MFHFPQSGEGDVREQAVCRQGSPVDRWKVVCLAKSDLVLSLAFVAAAALAVVRIVPGASKQSTAAKPTRPDETSTRG